MLKLAKNGKNIKNYNFYNMIFFKNVAAGLWPRGLFCLI